MKNVKFSTATSIFILVIFIAGIYYFGKPDSSSVNDDVVVNKEQEVVVEEEAKIVDLALVEAKTYKEPNDYLVFDVSYPSFKNASPELNKKIEDLVMAEIAAQKDYAQDSWKARYETSTDGSVAKLPPKNEKFSLSASYKLVQANSDYISVLLTIGGYSGGAHGFQNLYSFNYDVKAESEITLQKLFPTDPKYLNTLSAIARKDLEAQLKKRLEIKNSADEVDFKESILPMLRAGSEPTLENFKVFTFTPDAVTIYFVEYQVAPYAAGESTVVIPR
jgi:hypothetical protein